MAMEIFVLSDRRLNSVADWQHSIDAELFPLRLSADVPFTALSGFLPAQINDTKTGFECDHWSPQSTVGAYANTKFSHPWKYALAFRFGSRAGELESAWMAATAYARATRGVVFDTEEGKIFEPHEALEVVRSIERDRPATDAILEEIKRKFSAKP